MTTIGVSARPGRSLEGHLLPNWANLLLRGLAQLMVTAAVLIALFIADELWFSNILAARSQTHLRHELTKQWAAEASAPKGAAVPPVKLGGGIGILYIPAFGSGYHYVIVQGVNTKDLEEGPGHYPGTANPGQIGNFVVSGHRTTYLHPFFELGDLKVGDQIVVETESSYYTYNVTQSEVVLPTDLAVVAPVPGDPGLAPTQALLTLTTCDPKYSASHRLIVHGVLASTRPRADGPPASLKQEA